MLDFLIVLTSVVDLITGLSSDSVGGGNLSALRSLRAAKPLRGNGPSWSPSEHSWLRALCFSG